MKTTASKQLTLLTLTLVGQHRSRCSGSTGHAVRAAQVTLFGQHRSSVYPETGTIVCGVVAFWNVPLTSGTGFVVEGVLLF